MNDLDNEKLMSLSEEGRQFQYGNFIFFDQIGYPETIKQEYFVWQMKVENFILSKFGSHSQTYNRLVNYKINNVLSIWEDKILIKQQFIMSILLDAQEILAYEDRIK